MREVLEEEGQLPTSIYDLQRKIDLGRGKKNQLWSEIFKKISLHFNIFFDPKKIARKWQTLFDGFKKANDLNNQSGNGPTRFKFFNEMNDLVGYRHDVNAPVTGTAKHITINRPEESSTSAPARSESAPKKRKRKSDDDALLTYLRESDAQAAERQRELVLHMQNTEKAMLGILSKLLDK